MRNLKKVLCLALVLSMILAVVSGAAYYRDAYRDADDIIKINEEHLVAIQVLNDLGIVVGNLDTTKGRAYDLAGDEVLTRAAMARILYVLSTGAEEGYAFYPGEAFDSLPCTFTDIEDSWARKEIKYGFKMGYLSGRNATTFDPTAEVTAREFATALEALIGYEKADLAADWPSNVIIYGYKKDCNLFTSGYSSSAADVTKQGYQIAGYQLGSLTEGEAELSLGEGITRQDAIYMIYKAIAKASMVYKIDDEYLELGTTYLENEWNVTIDIEHDVWGTVYASENNSYYGELGETTGDAGVVAIEQEYYFEDDQGNGYWESYPTYYQDIGMAYSLIYNEEMEDYYGFDIQYKNWDNFIGCPVEFNVTTIYKDGEVVGGPYINNYDFDFDDIGLKDYSDYGAVAVETVSVPMNSDVSFDGTTLTIDGNDYTLYEDGAYVIVNDATTFCTDIADVAAEIGNGCAVGTDGLTADELTLTVVDGAISVAVETEKTGYDESKATKIAKASVVISGDKNYINSVADENEIKFVYVRGEGDASNTALKLSCDETFESNTGKYYDFVLVDGFVYECTAMDKVKTVSAGVVKANTRVVSTNSGKASYTIVVAESADNDAQQFKFSFTVDLDSADDTKYTGMTVDSVVTFKYDVKTLAASGLAMAN